MSGAVLRVNLGRIIANLETLRMRLDPAEVMFVVKNDAYGHGVEAVAGAAARHGVGWFGAFDVPTGLRVRAAVGDAPRVFAWATATRSEVDAAVRSGLDLGVGDARYLEDIAAVSSGRSVPVHLKIDTGLHRNGVRREDWPAFVARAAALESEGHVRVVGIWSHLAETSDAGDDHAREEFLDAVAVASAAGLRPEVRHLAASAAAFAREEFRFDLTRIGAFGYGIRSADGPELPGITAAASLIAPVIDVHSDSVLVDVGALDGVPSSLGGTARVGTPAGPRQLVAVHDTTLEIERWPDATVGDDVVVFGPGLHGESTATTLAEGIDTVGEELLVRLSPRIRRLHVES